MMAELFAGIRDAQTMGGFMEEIMTPAEISDLILRWKLLKRLQAGVPQRRIARELGVSLCKITRGARILRRPGSVTAAILRAHETQEPSSGRQAEV